MKWGEVGWLQNTIKLAIRDLNKHLQLIAIITGIIESSVSHHINKKKEMMS
jgi:hypothetical protein